MRRCLVRRAKLNLDMSELTMGEFGWPGGSMVSLEVIQN